MAEFARAGGSLSGQWSLSALPRLSSFVVTEAIAPPASVQWRVNGEQQPGNDGSVKVYLQLEASAPVQLRCERCLQGVGYTVHARRRIRFVKDEQTAAQLDALDDEEDVLALPDRLDLRELIEEELILALPLAPRHEDCRLPAAAAEGQPEPQGRATPHPFAALAALKKNPPDPDQGA